jgi:hypothetical protein
MEVQKQLGGGFLESVIKEAFPQTFNQRGIQIEKEKIELDTMTSF